jgi:hypothetical protein
MKKSIVLCCCLFYSCLGWSQFVVGGSFNFNSFSFQDEASIANSKKLNVGITPRLGYQFGHWWTGLDIGYSIETNKGTNSNNLKIDQKTTGFLIGPFVRYVWQPNRFMGIFGEAQVFGQFRSYFDADIKLNKYNQLTGLIRPGIMFYFGKRFIVEGSFGNLGFDRNKYKSVPPSLTGDFTENAFALSLNPSTFKLGVNWLFGAAASTPKN